SGSGAFAQRAETFLGRYPGLWEEIAEQAGSSENYPIRSKFTLALGGAQCEQGKQDAGVTAGDIGEAVGGIGGRIAGGLFKRRKKEEEPQPAAADASMTELLAISTEPVAVSS